MIFLAPDPFGVEILTKEHWKIPLEDFIVFLEQTRYLVAGADTIAELKKKAPENYNALKIWLEEKRSARVLDEIHVLDNYKTARFQACEALKATVQISMTGTPTQHSLAKLPTIFKLSLPDHMQLSEAEYKKMKKDPRAAIHRLRAFSTIFSIEDMAGFFEDPKHTPYDVQLQSGPKIPRVRHRTLEPELSTDQSLTLLDLTYNYSKWALAHNRSSDPLTKIWAMRQLIANPQKLGIDEHNPVLDAVLKECKESVAKGKRTLIYTEHLYPLHELYKALRAKGIGVYLLDGTVTPEERERDFAALETDPNVFIGLAQNEASGGGFNNRNISKIIILEEPKTVGGHIQIFGRGQRPLFTGQEEFARESIEIVTVVPKFAGSLKNDLKKMNLPTDLPSNTIYSDWNKRRQQMIARYRIATTRELTGDTSLLHALEEIDSAITQAQEALFQMHLYTQELIAEHQRRNKSDAKETWRKGFVFRNLEQVLYGLLPSPQEAKALIMAGIQGHEVPLLLDLGFQPQNIIAADNEKNPELQEAIHQALTEYKVSYRVASVEQLLRTGEKFDFISIDPYGPLSLSWIRTLQFANFDSLALSTNVLKRREDTATGNVLKALPQKRQDLMTLATKLCGTQEAFDSLTSNVSGNLLVQLAFLQARFSPIADQLVNILGDDRDSILDFLLEFALRCPHLHFAREHSYKSANGSPFYGRFALLKKWDKEILSLDSAEVLTQLLSSTVTHIQVNVNVKTHTDMVAINVGDNTYVISQDGLRELYESWASNVTPEYRFSGLLLDRFFNDMQSSDELMS